MNITPINFNVSSKQNPVNLKMEEQTTPVTNSKNYASVPAYCYAANAITFGNKTRAFNMVSGMKDVKQSLLEVVNNVIGKKEGPSGVLLYGPPGCGKTYITRALAAETKLPIYYTDISEVAGMAPRKLTKDEKAALLLKENSQYVSKYLPEVDYQALMEAKKAGEINYKEQIIYEDVTLKNIQNIFNQLTHKFKDTGKQSILLFDDADCIFRKMGNSQREQITKLLDNAKENGIVPVFTTNSIKSMDIAVTSHPSIKHINIAKPNYEDRIKIIKDRLNIPMAKHLIDDSKFIEELAEMSSDFSTADILRAINDTAFKTIWETNGKQPIAKNDLIASMKELKEKILSSKQ